MGAFGQAIRAHFDEEEVAALRGMVMNENDKTKATRKIDGTTQQINKNTKQPQAKTKTRMKDKNEQLENKNRPKKNSSKA